MKVTDPVIVQYIFYHRWLEGDDEEAKERRRACFEEALREAVGHIYGLAGEEAPSPCFLSLKRDRHLSQPIFNSGQLWRDDGKRVYFVEARTHGDIFTLELGYTWVGDYEPRVFAEMRGEIWHPLRDDLFGESICLGGLAGEGVAEEDFGELSRAVFLSWAGLGEELSQISLPYGQLHRLADHSFLLLYPNREAEARASDFFHELFPALEIHRQKIERLLTPYEEEIYPRAEGAEREVDAQLDLAAIRLEDLEHLEARLNGLAVRYTELADCVSDILKMKNTISISRENLEGYLGRLFGGSPPKDDRMFLPSLERYRLREEQMEADLSYLRATLDEAEVAFQAIGAQVSIERGQIEGRTNLILGIIGAALAVGQVVDSELAGLIWDALFPRIPLERGLGIVLVRVGAILLAAVSIYILGSILRRLGRRVKANGWEKASGTKSLL
ncbi:MAG TPA: hypothetical protein EYP17_05505 [Candidatus Latescibacteria bacterium]|nr:hypothetical protein [Candidatus Latescibacterota bacterium]